MIWTLKPLAILCTILVGESIFASDKITKSICHVITPTSSGSGVIVSKTAALITNAHIVKTKGKIAKWIDLKCGDGSRYRGKRIEFLGSMKNLDLAIVRLALNRPLEHWIPLYRGGLTIGQPITIQGFPTDSNGGYLHLAKTAGRIEKILPQKKLFKSSASIAPGSSGSPVLTTSGELAGIVTSGRRDDRELYGASFGHTSEAIKMALAARDQKSFIALKNSSPGEIISENDNGGGFFDPTPENSIPEQLGVQAHLLKTWEKFDQLDTRMKIIVITFLVLIVFVFGILLTYIWHGLKWVYNRIYFGKYLHNCKSYSEERLQSLLSNAYKNGQNLKYSSYKNDGPLENTINNIREYLKNKTENIVKLENKENDILEDLAIKEKKDVKIIKKSFETFFNRNAWITDMLAYLFIATEFFSTFLFVKIKLQETQGIFEQWLYSFVVALILCLAILITKKIQHRFARGVEWLYWLLFIPSIITFVYLIATTRSGQNDSDLFQNIWFIVSTMTMAGVGALLMDYIKGHPKDNDKYSASSEIRTNREKEEVMYNRGNQLLNDTITKSRDAKDDWTKHQEQGAKSLWSRLKNSPQDIDDYLSRL